MKLPLAISALFMSTLSFAAIDQGCWDGTFGYNYARAIETKRGIEISFTGSSLKVPLLWDNWGQATKFETWTNNGRNLHIVLPNNPEVKGKKTVFTDKVKALPATDENPFPLPVYPTLYLERGYPSLGQWKVSLFDIELEQVEASISEGSIELSFVQNKAPGATRPRNKISVSCNHGFAPDSVRLPEELTQYLDSKN